jgi:hypothetical protein
MELHFLPPYCPNDNRIEGVWRDAHPAVVNVHRQGRVHSRSCVPLQKSLPKRASQRQALKGVAANCGKDRYSRAETGMHPDRAVQFENV